MEYRSFGKVDFSPSALGFGAMRLPTLPGVSAVADTTTSALDSIDHDAATAMLRYAIEHGVNYVDTAYDYHGGASEAWLGSALRDVARALHGRDDAAWTAFRRRLKVATKLPAWKCRERADFERYFGEQLERLRLPSVDFYLLHSLSADSWAQVHDIGVLEWAKKARAKGRITHFGFSFHDDLATFKKIVDATKLWEFCQIQYNYMDEDYQAGSEGLRYAARKGLGVVVMEPIRGGHLAGTPPDTVAALWRRAEARRLRRRAADSRRVGPAVGLGPRCGGPCAERHEHDGAGRRERRRRRALGARPSDRRRACPHRPGPRRLPRAHADRLHGLRLLSALPRGRQDPAHLGHLQRRAHVRNEAGARQSYTWIGEEHRADRCTHCGECEARCPQMLPVIEWLEVCQRFLCEPPPEAS